MPRLRQPTVKKEEPFDSTKVEKPVDEKPEEGTQLEAVADDQPPEEVVVEEPKKEEPKQDEAALALKRQLDTLRGNEEALRRAVQEREEAIRQHQEKLIKAHRQTLEQEEVAIDSTLNGYRAEAEKAQLDVENAISLGDAKAQSEAHRRMVQAEARITQLEAGREALKERKRQLKKERRKAEEAASQPQQQPQNYPPHVLQWQKDHSDYITDPKKNKDLQWAFLQAEREGHEPLSVPHVERINELLGFTKTKQEAQPQPEHRTNIVSAPVSREVASTGTGQRAQGKITLTRDEIEAAQMSGITPAEYARQKAKLMEMKANGEYGDRR